MERYNEREKFRIKWRLMIRKWNESERHSGVCGSALLLSVYGCNGNEYIQIEKRQKKNPQKENMRNEKRNSHENSVNLFN